VFLISNFRRVLNVVCFLLGNSPASEFVYADVSEHSVPSSWAPVYEDGTECSETLACKIQTPGSYPEESIQHVESGLSFIKLENKYFTILSHTY
jgi:hypothetical protein